MLYPYQTAEEHRAPLRERALLRQPAGLLALELVCTINDLFTAAPSLLYQEGTKGLLLLYRDSACDTSYLEEECRELMACLSSHWETALYGTAPGGETGELTFHLEEGNRILCRTRCVSGKPFDQLSGLCVKLEADSSEHAARLRDVLGRTNHRRRRGWWNKKALVDRLTELAPNLDVYIIPDRQPAYRPKWKIAPSELSFSWKDTGKMLGILAAATLLGELFSRLGFGETNIVTVYILGVLLTATWTEGRLYGILSSLLSVLTFNFFFTEPYFSLDAHPSYVITFFIMFLSSFLTSSLTIRIKTQARMAVQKNYSTEVLLEATQLLQQASGEHEVLAIAVSQLGKLLDRPILYYPMDPDGQLMQARIYPETESDLLSRYTGGQEKAVADWVCKNNKHAGAGTHTLPNSRCLYLAVRSHGGPQAVVGIPCDDYPLPEAFEQNLIRGILNQAGIVLEQRLSDLRRADTPSQGDSL